MAAVKEKIVDCIAINLAKERCGDPNKKHEFYIEAEDLFKHLLLCVLTEKAKNGDPLDYVEFLENVEELCDLDYYDVWWLESEVLK